MAGNFGFQLLGFTSALNSISDLLRYRVNNTWYVGTNVHYGAYVEFGTSRMQAQPFLRPAAREVSGDLEEYFSRHNSGDAALKAVALDVERQAKKNCPVDTGNLKGSIRIWQE